MAEKVQVIKYKCACGKKYSTKRLAERHEENCKCWTNPKFRTCKTCRFGKQVQDSDDAGNSWKQWQCSNPEFNYDIHFKAAHTNAPDLCINCLKWESKNHKEDKQ